MRRRNVWAIVLFVAALWAASLWRIPGAKELPTQRGDVEAIGGPGGESPRKLSGLAPPAVATKNPARFAPPSIPTLKLAELIADVSIDKPVVCPGEDFLVSVRPRAGAGASELAIAELTFNIGGRFGRSIALTADEPGLSQHTIVASNGVDQIEYRPFSIEVRQADDPHCQARAGLSLAVDRGAHEAGAVVARVVGTSGLEGALRYVFDFGDGTVVESDDPAADHSYALREQPSGTSSYIIEVRAIDARDRTALGRASFHLVNNHYRARAFGDRLMPVVYERFPRRTRAGYGVDVQLRSLEPDDVLIERATITEKSCLAGREDRVQTVQAAMVGAPGRIRPKQLRSVALDIPRSLVSDDVCVLELELSGDTETRRVGRPMDERTKIPYRPVVARLTLELSAAPPIELGGSPELASREITDPGLLSELQRVTDALGQRHVTRAELARLRGEATGR